jgi:acyl transferase domain-containing protein/acyl carrier protein
MSDGIAPSAVSSGESLAIIGMSCRFPGGIHSPAQLWEFVAGCGDAISSFPIDRGWDLAGLDPNICYVAEGGFLTDAAEFDAEFFGVGPREALAMEPQHRLMLEGAWEAFESAGLDPYSLVCRDTAVFAGAVAQNYGVPLHLSTSGFVYTGTTASVLSGRVAYALGLRGPAMTIDTACSSSLVALHLASHALHLGECSLALAGGVTVMATPGMLIDFGRRRGLAADGRCKPFAEAADGTVWSEGMGLVLLERLSDAQANKHEVLAVVRGSAVNQDGSTDGLTVPNGLSQQLVIRRALQVARLTAAEVDTVEAHGTGTSVGDPIEAQALLATYGQGRLKGRPLWLGSVKSNIGHTQAAAGIAGVIKMVMAMRHGMLPATLHIDQPSTRVDWGAGAIALLTEPQAWESHPQPRRAAVSSFGISGTNAHVILEQAPVVEAAAIPRVSGTGKQGSGSASGLGLIPLVVSGRGVGGLAGQARQLRRFVQDDLDISMADVGYSLACRAKLEDRAVVVGRDREQLLAGLHAIGRGEPAGTVVGGSARVADTPVFLFAGQGSQWVGMAADLLERWGLFAEQIAACEQALSAHVEWLLAAVLTGAEGAPELERVDVLQPALFAVVVSLARCWQACGVHPAAVVGHSQGEIAAACVAGALSLDDAARVIASRGRALCALAGSGGMVSLSLGAREVEALIERLECEISLAAVNGASSVVVSGANDALERLLAYCKEINVRARRISVDYAAHSAHVEEIRGELLAGCVGITPRAGDIAFYSTVTGTRLDTHELDGEYWYRNLRETVKFEQITRKLLNEGQRAFIEISPHPVLTVGVGQTIEAHLPGHNDQMLVSGTLRRDCSGPDQFLLALGEAWTHGVNVDWATLFADTSARRVELPTYAFQRQRYWLESDATATNLAAAGQASAEHPLLGAIVALANGKGWLFTGRLSTQSHPWLTDHTVRGVTLVPGAALVDLALHAGKYAGRDYLTELTLQTPMILPPQGELQIQLALGAPDESGQAALRVYSRPYEDAAGDQPWTFHASGMLTTNRGPMPVKAQEVGVWPPEGGEWLPVDELYEGLAEHGLEYGPAFQGLTAAWRRGGELFCEVALSGDQVEQANKFALHPALLDAAFHAALLFGDGSGKTRLPFTFTGVRLYERGATSLRVRLDSKHCTLTAVDAAGTPIVHIDALSMREVSSEQMRDAGGTGRDALFKLHWEESELASRPDAAVSVAVLGGEDSLVARALMSAGLGVVVHDNLAGLTMGDPLPELVLVDLLSNEWEGRTGSVLLDDTYESLRQVLSVMQGWLADERLTNSRLAFVTQRAVAVEVSERSLGLARSPVWGLVRSAQSENPGRFVLIDVERPEDLEAILEHALDIHESQLAVRGGILRVPRLHHAQLVSTRSDPLRDSTGTALITGGTGTLGTLLARHLVSACGVRHLLLVSRRGEAANGARELQGELQGLGAHVTIAACDVAVREQLEEIIDAIPADHPLRIVIHAAGVLDDGILKSLDPSRLERPLRPKLDAAWHLHELTRELPIEAFVLFSSVAGTLGSPGQANYAAANTFLDVLAAYRHANGLPAAAIAWGPWARASELTNTLSDTDRQRMRRSGLLQLATEHAFVLLDKILTSRNPFVLAAPLDLKELRRQARIGFMPAIYKKLIQPVSDERETLGSRLARIPPTEHRAIVLRLVQKHILAVLGGHDDRTIAPNRTFKDLGFESLTAVELRNRLNTATGLELPATLVFDYPTPADLCHYLERLAADNNSPANALFAELAKIEGLLSSQIRHGKAGPEISKRVQLFARRLETLVANHHGQRKRPLAVTLESASDSELFDAVDKELAHIAETET